MFFIVFDRCSLHLPKISNGLDTWINMWWSFIFLLHLLFFLEYCSFNTLLSKEYRVYLLLTKVHHHVLDYGHFWFFFSVERIPRMNKMSSNIYLVNGNLFVAIHRFVGIILSNTASLLHLLWFWHFVYWTVSITHIQKKYTLV